MGVGADMQEDKETRELDINIVIIIQLYVCIVSYVHVNDTYILPGTE